MFAKLREVKIANWVSFLFLIAIMIGVITGCKGEEEKPLKSLSTSVVPVEYAGSMRKCNTWRDWPFAGTLGGYGKWIQAS